MSKTGRPIVEGSAKPKADQVTEEQATAEQN